MSSSAALRLRTFLEWRGWSQSQFAAATKHHSTLINRLLSGKRSPGLDVAHAIEVETEKAREDGAKFPGGPIRTEEWLEVAHIDGVRPSAKKLPPKRTRARRRAA